jgi:uncharacterized protein YdaU (DUF1376 family)
LEGSLFRAGLSDRFFTPTGCDLPEFPPDRPAPKEIALHYYQFNIGDYRRDTQHLGLLEHGIYRQILDTYYLNGGPLKADHDQLMRTHCVRTAEEKQAYESVIKDFFEQDGGLLIHNGCDKVIAAFRRKSEVAAASANARWKPSDADAMRTHSERNANGMLTNNHKPITNNQEPVKNNTRLKALECPPGIPSDLWQDFCQHRRSQRSSITQTALKGIEREALKAGWSLEAALRECVLRGWRGFKAEWVEKSARQEKESRKHDHYSNLFGERKDDGRTIEAATLRLG